MKRFMLVFTLLAVGLLASFVSLESSSEAASHPGWSSGPLLSCPDVDGNGAVGIPDVLLTASAFGTFGAVGSNYAYLYDVGNGDGVVNIPDDIIFIASQFSLLCPDLINRQVAVASSAMVGRCSAGITVCPDLRNWSEAQSAGYIQSTQYVPQMGIHVYNLAYQGVYTRMDDAVCDPSAETYDVSVCQLERPVGLVYTDSNPDPDIADPDLLIGAWYQVPNPEVCAYFGNPNPGSCQPSGGEANEPIGFGTTNTDEDNTDVSAYWKGWHDHTGLCSGDWGGSGAWVVETGQATQQSENNCLNNGFFQGCGASGCSFFYNYGWMMHLYNFVPNPAGRFMQWSSNLP